MVTNAVTYLPHADQIVVLKEGVISEVGTYKELLEKEGAFADFINTHAAKDNGGGEEEEEGTEDEEEGEDGVAEEGESSADKASSPAHSQGRRRKSSVKSNSLSPRRNSQKPTTATAAPASPKQPGAKLTTEEGVEKGRVKAEVMVTYLRSVGWFFTTLTLLMFLAQNAFMFYSSVWLKDWADGALPKTVDQATENGTAAAETGNGTTLEVSSGNRHSAAFSSEVYLGVYAVLGVAQGITILLCKFQCFQCFQSVSAFDSRSLNNLIDLFLSLITPASVAIAIGCVRACISLHSSMLRNVLAAPMSFFDTVPLGRILNRFCIFLAFC